uniref:Phosducinlike protein putative n=1 Tax=Albugo laibachii Nc14 TaxID=890382 RepID=F0WMS1_9STRA|nr:phosducinlike protein putative [Albugo laibachii Nc14]|eukprot:CCA22606.1 phosducinlike protein putative [Albugo laibachii Nc14]
MDRGQKYYEPTGETTEWEDILVKKGIIAPKTKVEEEEKETEEDDAPSLYEKKTLDELTEFDDDYDDASEIARIRQRRITEMKEAAKRAVYGEVYPISKDEWTIEVTDASKEKQCWVVAYLWDTAVDDCKLADQLVRELSKRHRDVKFVSIQSQACIENWPKRNLPTLFMYYDGYLRDQILSLHKLKGMNTKVEDLEEKLASIGVFRPPKASRLQDNTEEDDED